MLDPPGQEGPKGSLTINDIRLPLKKEFVTKIGTASGVCIPCFSDKFDMCNLSC